MGVVCWLVFDRELWVGLYKEDEEWVERRSSFFWRAIVFVALFLAWPFLFLCNTIKFFAPKKP